MHIDFFLANVQINPPENWQQLEFELNFERDKNSNRVTITEWRFLRENADLIHAWRNGGLTTGGIGVFEGIPFRIEVRNQSVSKVLFNGYLDLTEKTVYASKQYVTTTAKESQQVDWLQDVAFGFGPEFLKATGQILQTDYIYMPYVNSCVPNYRDSFIALMGIFTVTMQLYKEVVDLTNIIIGAANPFEATALIRLIPEVAYITILLIAQIRLIKDLVNLLIQPVKYHACMTVKKQIEKCCAHLNMTFSSDIFNSPSPFENLVILPEKYYIQTNSGDPRLLGFTSPNSTDQNGFYKGMFGDLLQEMKKMFCGKLVIKNGVLYFLRRDQGLIAPIYQVPDVDERAISLNTSEFKSNYNISFQVDVVDKNTFQEYDGTRFQSIIRPASFSDPKNILMKGLERVDIDFARAKTKRSLTTPEQLVLDFLDVVSGILNGIISVINKGIEIYNDVAEFVNKIIDKLDTIGIKINIHLKTIKPLDPVDFGQLIENRIGMLKLEQDQVGKQKIFIITIGSSPKFNKVHPLNDVYVNTTYLYNNYHSVATSFIPSSERLNANQYWEKELTGVPFTWQDFLDVSNTNQCKNSSGLDSEVTSLKWNPYNQVATSLKYKVNQIYTTNFIETKISPNGS